jgi:hypothetical protein
LADTELPSDLVLGPTATDRLDDLTTALNRQALLLMSTSRRSVVSVKATPWRTIGRSFKARVVQISMIGRLWQPPDR